MIVLHHLNNSRSQRILWLLEELGLEYKLQRYERDPVTILAPPSLKKVHPLGKSPVITEGDVTLAESGAIIEYLIQTHGNGQFKPRPDSADYWQYVFWMHYAEGSLMPPLLLRLVFEKVKENPAPFFVKPIIGKIVKETNKRFIGPQIKTHMGYVNDYLAQHSWLAGDALSGADFQMSFPLEAAVARGTVGAEYPNIVRYVKQFQSRPAYQKALEVGGEYNYA